MRPLLQVEGRGHLENCTQAKQSFKGLKDDVLPFPGKLHYKLNLQAINIK